MMDGKRFPRGTVACHADDQEWEQNCQTLMGIKSGVFSREPLPGQIALSRYETALRRAHAEHPPTSVFITTVDNKGAPARHEVLAPGEAIVFGRHDRAQLKHSSRDVSLRHIAVAVGHWRCGKRFPNAKSFRGSPPGVPCARSRLARRAVIELPRW